MQVVPEVDEQVEEQMEEEVEEFGAQHVHLARMKEEPVQSHPPLQVDDSPVT